MRDASNLPPVSTHDWAGIASDYANKFMAAVKLCGELVETVHVLLEHPSRDWRTCPECRHLRDRVTQTGVVR